jgi:hypothetical protein
MVLCERYHQSPFLLGCARLYVFMVSNIWRGGKFDMERIGRPPTYLLAVE